MSTKEITTTFWMLCLFPLIGAAAESQTTETALGRRVEEMFQVGYARGPRAMQESQHLYDSIKIASRNDPRVDFAHGLVLLKLLRNKEAKAEFLVAAKRPGVPYFPAWQALVWSHLVAKETEDGCDRLVEFAKLIHSSDDLTDDVRREETYWIGRAMAALEMTLESNQSREIWIQTDTRITEQLGKVLIDAYNSGKEDVHAKHLVLEDDIRQSREKDKERQAELKDKKINQLDKSAEAAKEKRDNLKKSAEDLKEEFEEQSATYKKQIERMEKDYALLERRNLSLVTQMLTFDQQINLMQTPRNSNPASGGGQTLAALQNRRALIEAEFQLTTASTQQLAVQAQKLIAERAERIEQYQRATGDIVKEESNAQKWKERTEKQTAELKKNAKKVKLPTPALASKIQAVTSFRTYCDLDLIVERDKVLASFGITHK